MLKGINPLLTGDVLALLSDMGHGDELAIVDANFPAVTMARRLVRLNASAPIVLEQILNLLPLDDFVEAPLTVMEVVGAPDQIPDCVRDFQKIADASEGKEVKLCRLERYAFYERTRKAFGIVATDELRLYGCVLVRKGVIRTE
jgi:L-fucose mutarotase